DPLPPRRLRLGVEQATNQQGATEHQCVLDQGKEGGGRVLRSPLLSAFGNRDCRHAREDIPTGPASFGAPATCLGRLPVCGSRPEKITAPARPRGVARLRTSEPPATLLPKRLRSNRHPRLGSGIVSS